MTKRMSRQIFSERVAIIDATATIVESLLPPEVSTAESVQATISTGDVTDSTTINAGTSDIGSTATTVSTSTPLDDVL